MLEKGWIENKTLPRDSSSEAKVLLIRNRIPRRDFVSIFLYIIAIIQILSQLNSPENTKPMIIQKITEPVVLPTFRGTFYDRKYTRIQIDNKKDT